MKYPTRVLIDEVTGAAVGSHAAADTVGARLEWALLKEAGTRAGLLVTVIVGLNSTEQPALELFLFGGPFVAGTDDSPVGFAAADQVDYSLGSVKIFAADWGSNANSGVATVNLVQAVACHERNQSGILYGQLVARSAFTPTGMWVKLGVSVDS